MDMKLTMLRIRSAINYFLTPRSRRAVAITRDGKVYRGTVGYGKCQVCGKNVAKRECDHGVLCTKCDEQIHGSVGGRCEVNEQ